MFIRLIGFFSTVSVNNTANSDKSYVQNSHEGVALDYIPYMCLERKFKYEPIIIRHIFQLNFYAFKLVFNKQYM